MIDVQATLIRQILTALNPAPRDLDLPKLDETQLTWVYPQSVEFLELENVRWRDLATSINGATVSIEDRDQTMDGAAITPAADFGILYQAVTVRLAGGTVSPIDITVSAEAANAAGTDVLYAFAQNISLPNPGQLTLRSAYIHPGHRLTVNTGTNGGAGDTLNLTAYGIRHRAGSPLPLIPGNSVVEFS